MNKLFRYFLFFICAVQFILAVAFFLQLPFATNLWPYSGTTPLTFIFVSSIFAAAAASTLWAAATENYGALSGIGIDYFAILAPVGVFSAQLGAGSSNPAMITYGIVCLMAAAFGIGLFLWSYRIPINAAVPMPRLVRWSFWVFIAALLVVSIQLILRVPDVIPWKITPDLSVIMGWFFIGASTYFAYGLLRPSWLNAAGQLAGFLAYDVVLIVPFLTRLPTTPPEFQLGLIIYTVIVIYSALLAIYFLFIHPTTRMFAKRGAAKQLATF